MKIHLRHYLLLKQIILLAVPVIVLLAVALHFFLPVRPSAPVEDKAMSQPKTASNVIPKARPAPLPKVRVITPVRVADEPFRGYDLPAAADRERDDGQEESAVQSAEATAACEELSTSAQRQEKTNKMHVPADIKVEQAKDKRVDQGELSAKRPSASAQGGSTDNAGSPDRINVEEAQAIQLLDDRAIEAGIPVTARKKLIQSYRDLCKVLPKKEAEKMIMWKIVHENHK